VTPHEVVIRLGRPFSVRLKRKDGQPDDAFATVTEVRIPFANRDAAESAQRDITVYVRQVHDAGGEDYRKVVKGDVIRLDPGEL
jgi:hypothetical protein